ncbi:hypothetical protein DRP53_08245, partial [candidate division WOR-3 bacterium]
MLGRVKFGVGLTLIPMVLLGYPPDGWRGMWNLAPADQYEHSESRIAVFGDTIHASYIKLTAEGNKVYYKRSTDGGFRWSNEVEISSG